MQCKYITYKETISKERALQAVDDTCRAIRGGVEPTENTIKRLCGTISYCAVFCVPDEYLKDGAMFTVEDICRHVPGLLSVDLRDMLYCLGDIAIGENIKGNLFKVLSSPTFPETTKMIGLFPAQVYKILLLYFACLNYDVRLIQYIGENVLEVNEWYKKFMEIYSTWVG